MAAVAEHVLRETRSHFTEATLNARGQARHNSRVSFEAVLPELQYVRDNRYPQLTQLPKDWDIGASIPLAEDVEVPLYYSPARGHTHTVLMLPMGFKGNSFALKDEVSILNSEGFSVMSFMQPYPGRRTDFMPTYEHVMDEAVFNPSSAFYTLEDPKLPRVVAPHSGNGLTYLRQKAKVDSERAAILAPHLAGVIQMGLFLDTANSSELTSRWISALYKLHAKLHFNMHCGKALLDRIYMGKNDMDPRTSTSYELPTHGQALRLREMGRDLVHGIHTRSLNALDNVPEVVMMGLKDKFSCVKTATTYAEKTGAAALVTNTGHNPPKESHQGLMLLMDLTWAMSEAHRNGARRPNLESILAHQNVVYGQQAHAALALDKA
jgi:hypothetical protein